VVALTEQEIIWLFLAAACSSRGRMAARARRGDRPPWLLAGIGGAVATGGTLVTLFLFFAQAGRGRVRQGLAIVRSCTRRRREHHWLTDQQFLRRASRSR